MELERRINHGSYWKTTYTIGTAVIPFEIEYLESKNKYEVRIYEDSYGEYNTYREAQIFCEGFVEGMINFQLSVKNRLNDLLDI